ARRPSLADWLPTAWRYHAPERLPWRARHRPSLGFRHEPGHAPPLAPRGRLHACMTEYPSKNRRKLSWHSTAIPLEAISWAVVAWGVVGMAAIAPGGALGGSC